MVNVSICRKITMLLRAICLLAMCSVQARLAIHWLQADLPPYFIQQGEFAGQGTLQRLQQLVQAELPDYQHHEEWQSLLRREQMLFDTATSYCSFGIVKTPERAAIKFSALVSVGAGYAVTLTEHGKLYQRWLEAKQPALLPWLIKLPDVIGLMESGRALPELVNQLAPGNMLTLPIATNPLTLLAHQRADFLVEYPARAEYLKRTAGMAKLKLHHHFLDERDVNLSYVACSPATSDQIINDINAAIAKAKLHPAYQDIMFSWHEPNQMPVLELLYHRYIGSTDGQEP
ncbi:hypothetical protein I4W93_018850 [Rheinheimera sp. MA13]|uniref:TIGR02285 family protein n=2 Tax=Rheinheimera maricola TaxID=2793282 RepID=A0ABS7XDL0_9GAMM|nr:hypothetical protein [Rheinheimera maricola]MBZ9613658.1 hypothetical protein [Rheinheimera maricola]